jgi:protein phosphatase
VEAGRLRIEFAGITDVGKKREANEDDFLVIAEENLFVVADGMGGHRSGEVASRTACESIAAFFRVSPLGDRTRWPHVAPHIRDPRGCRLASAIQYAHRRILATQAEQPETTGMATTVVALYLADSHAFIAHVGDSRCYRLAGGRLLQVTRDHTAVESMRHSYGYSPEIQEQLASFQHIVTRALGGKEQEDVPVDLTILLPKAGELFLLCSDGLTNELSTRSIAQFMRKSKDLPATCRSVVTRAKANGGRDNITAVLVRFVEGDPLPDMDVTAEDTLESVSDRELSGLEEA